MTLPGGPAQAPPGWYTDPSGVMTWRWWSGSSWTDYVWPLGPLARADYARERKAAPYAQLAFIAWVVAIGSGLLITWATSHQYRAYVDALRVQIENHNQTDIHPLHPPYFVYFVLLVQIPIFVGLLIWQFRAAKTARSLGLPAKHSAALGTWSWIIPVVMYWFPYQAIRDCLPWQEPNRRVVRRMWFCFVTMTVADIGAVGLIDIGLAEGAVLSGVALASGVGFAFTGVKSVRTIADVHGRLISSTS